MEKLSNYKTNIKNLQSILRTLLEIKKSAKQSKILNDNVKIFDSQLSVLIKHINDIDTSEDINIKINEFYDKMYNIIFSNKKDSVSTENVTIDKLDEYHSLSVSYYGLIDNYAQFIEELKQTSNKNYVFIYEKISKSVTKLLQEINNLKQKINDVTQKIINMTDTKIYTDHVYSITDIVLTSENIYNYTERLSFILPTEEIQGNPINIDNLAKIMAPVLQLKYENASEINIELLKDLSVGGNMEINKKQANELSDILINTVQQIQNINKDLEKLYTITINYKLYQKQKDNYIIYLILIVSTAHSNTYLPGMLTYKYINKGVLYFYLTLIDTIIKKIENNVMSYDIVYFKQNHYFTLKILSKHIKFVIGSITHSDIIDIEKCKGSIKQGFMLLIYIKDLLEGYKESLNNKVTVYARINDYQDVFNKVFKIKEDTHNIIQVNKQECVKVCKNCIIDDININEISFTEVFDTDKFKGNIEISKYLNLQTQLSKGKGVCMVTYGYSGTGKSFTLFGSNTLNKQGILQSTLENVRNLKSMKFRVAELYGTGVSYPHYWNTEYNTINQYTIMYDLYIDSNNKLIIKDGWEKDYSIKTKFASVDNYISFQENNMFNILKNFGLLVNNIDAIRKKENRIIETSNNKESSRSIIIYDFLLQLDQVDNNNYIPFVIIDLPGREDIIQTYVDNRISTSQENIEIKKIFADKFKQLLLSAMSINPLQLAILVPSIIFETFNALSDIERKYIVMTPISFKTSKTQYDSKYDIDINIDVFSEAETENNELEESKVRFSEEIVAIAKSKITGEIKELKMDYIYNFDDLWKKYKKFNMIPQKFANLDFKKEQDTIVKIKGSKDSNDIKPKHSEQVPVEINSIQYQGVLALHLLNRIILMNKFDVIEKIFKNIIKNYFFPINSKEIEKYNLNSLLAPLEGIYINESIVGLIKVLMHDVILKDDKYIKTNILEEQDTTLNFEYQKKSIRQKNIKLYSTEKLNSVKYENIYRNNNVINEMLEENKTMYSSQKIFNYDKPAIKEVFDIYINQRELDKNIVPITDFKLFYLINNIDADKKCAHQMRLLQHTAPFIESISKMF
jgi:hypothetical protein